MALIGRDEQGRVPGAFSRSAQQVCEPVLPDSGWPRYSALPLPAYRFVPGLTPHPRRHPNGHSYGQREPAPSALDPDHWRASDAYLYGVDLYNFAFWWECHEIFEGFWRAVPRTEQGRFFQALIHVAAANLKICMGNPVSADRLGQAALARFETMPQIYMGMDMRMFERDIRAYADGSSKAPALIRLLTFA